MEGLGVLVIQRGGMLSLRLSDLGAPVPSRLLGGREERVRFAAEMLDFEGVHDLVLVLAAFIQGGDSLQRVRRSTGIDMLQAVRSRRGSRRRVRRACRATCDVSDRRDALDIIAFLHRRIVDALQDQQVHWDRQSADIVLFHLPTLLRATRDRLRKHEVVIEQQSVRIEPSEPVPTHALQIAAVNELSAKVVEIETNRLLHLRPQDQLHLQIRHIDFPLHLSDAGIALMRHGGHLIDGKLQIALLLALNLHILQRRLQEQGVPLQTLDRRLQVRVPVQLQTPLVTSDLVDKVAELHIAIQLLPNHECRARKAACVVDICRLRLANPLSEDVCKSHNPRSLLVLAVLQLREQMLLVCLFDGVDATKDIAQKLVFPLR